MIPVLDRGDVAASEVAAHTAQDPCHTPSHDLCQKHCETHQQLVPASPKIAAADAAAFVVAVPQTAPPQAPAAVVAVTATAALPVRSIPLSIIHCRMLN